MNSLISRAQLPLFMGGRMPLQHPHVQYVPTSGSSGPCTVSLPARGYLTNSNHLCLVQVYHFSKHFLSYEVIQYARQSSLSPEHSHPQHSNLLRTIGTSKRSFLLGGVSYSMRIISLSLLTCTVHTFLRSKIQYCTGMPRVCRHNSSF